MRALLLELVAVTTMSVLIISAALGLLPPDPDGALTSGITCATATWLSRTECLVTSSITWTFPGANWADPSAFAYIRHRAFLSLTIIATTTALLLLLGVPLGILSGTHSDSRLVQAVRRTVSAVSSLPILVLATLLFLVQARVLGKSVRADDALPAAIASAVAVLLFGDRLLADVVQRVELSTRAILAESYMRTVRAAALGLRRHLLQSLVPPVAEAIAARAMFLISAAIVAEVVFDVHGLGFTVVHALMVPGDRREILAASLALVAIGVLFRILHRTAVAMADSRRRA